MKKLLLLSLSLLSLQSFAFSTIKIKSDAVLTYSKNSDVLEFSINANSDEALEYCSVTLSTKENFYSMIIPEGTVFEVTSVEENVCIGRQCSLELNAYNLEKNTKLSLFCRNAGQSVSKIKAATINKLLKNVFTIK